MGYTPALRASTNIPYRAPSRPAQDAHVTAGTRPVRARHCALLDALTERECGRRTLPWLQADSMISSVCDEVPDRMTVLLVPRVGRSRCKGSTLWEQRPEIGGEMPGCYSPCQTITTQPNRAARLQQSLRSPPNHVPHHRKPDLRPAIPSSRPSPKGPVMAAKVKKAQRETYPSSLIWIGRSLSSA